MAAEAADAAKAVEEAKAPVPGCDVSMADDAVNLAVGRNHGNPTVTNPEASARSHPREESKGLVAAPRSTLIDTCGPKRQPTDDAAAYEELGRAYIAKQDADTASAEADRRLVAAEVMVQALRADRNLRDSQSSSESPGSHRKLSRK